MIILALDPSIRRTGWAVVRLDDGLTALDYGAIETRAKDDNGDRLAVIRLGVEAIIETWQPDTAALEQPFVGRNPNTAIVLGGVLGVLRCVLSVAKVRYMVYPPREVKLRATGSGGAQKADVQAAMKTAYRLTATPGEDEADALAVAVTHAHTLRGVTS